ncbi:MAG: hypothetical protein ACD_12C00827G0002 [uncultured bacterium]|nr:MAG: hypothetical protein ACD_12C00827G0002 [uncultured bacterium]
MSIILGFIFGYIVSEAYERIGLNFTKKMGITGLIVFGYRLHHSLYGLIIIIIGLLFNNLTNPLLLISIGLGNIIQHYFSGDGLVFITKEKNK